MGINTALDAGVGGALEGVGMLFTRANGKKLITLQEKVNAGKATPEDKKELIRIYDKLERASEDITLAKSNVAEDYTAKGKGLQDKALKESQAKAIDELKVNIDNAKIRLSKAKSADRAGIIRRQIRMLEGELKELQGQTAVVKDGNIQYNAFRRDKHGTEIRTGTGTATGRGTTDIPDAFGGTQGRAFRNEAHTERSVGGDKAVSTEKNVRHVLSNEQYRAMRKYGMSTNGMDDISSSPEDFIATLKGNAATQKFGIAVDSNFTAKDLEGAKLYTSKNKTVTIGVKPDGDIFGLAKKAGASRKDFEEAMMAAIGNGGIKLDAYGRGLSNRYELFGFEPVARVEYSESVIIDRMNEEQATMLLPVSMVIKEMFEFTELDRVILPDVILADGLIVKKAEELNLIEKDQRQQDGEIAYEMIKSSDLIGISNQELELIALLVRHHSDDFASLTYEELFISPQEKLNFVKLAVLLSMANALDTGHKSKVKRITTEVRKRHIKVILESNQDLTLESWSFQKTAKHFQRIFGTELRLSIVYENGTS